MAEVEVLLPKMGESVAEATITKWLKNEGDSVDADEAIVEIATDKVDSEVPVPQGGILIKRLCNEGDVVQVGKPIAIISSANGTSASANGARTSDAQPAPTPQTSTQPAPVAEINQGEGISRMGSDGRFYSPLVRSIAETEGLNQADLEKIKGSGIDGRVTKKDLMDFLANRGAATQKVQPAETGVPAASSQSPKPAAGVATIKAPAVSLMAGDEIMEMDRMRKLIADHMVMSKHVSPHVTSYVEADVTNLVLWREKVKKKFEERYGEKLTFTPLFIEALVRAIKDLPLVNVSVDGDKIIKRKQINMGMATALPSGNLIVPVIRNADQYNLSGLARMVNDLAARARINKLSPDEIQGGTYTITNVGTFGNVMGTPIINQPQAAIMAVGAIRKKPAVIETPAGDFIGIRHMMFLSHSYDHRVVDGALGGSFVRKVADYLEQFDINREV